ncbi:F-box/kelch-repeat protein [Cardamine amara subsp. amara]|uniref:F-box/kelch-repeat protein n=1 Tax=Cardamine amara subsp. amara TaxID=228776 RepID=A0ABD1A5P6_CARAN
MSDLPKDMEEELLSRLPVTSLGEVRSTCKKWNTLTKGESLLKRHIAKKKQRKGIEVVMMLEYRVSLMSVDLLYPSIERIGNLDADGVEISKIFHCDGLFLCCITKDKDSSRLLVWNPYLAQTRWIELRNSFRRWDRYALGYDNEKKNHKVLRFVDDYDSDKHRICEFEMYSLNSNSWKVMDDFTLDWGISFTHRGLSLKGNTYWYAEGKIPLDSPRWISDLPDCLLSFDFTTERFGPPLPLPFHAFRNTVTLSSVREEQLAVLLQNMSAPYTVKIWITTKIEPNSVSWSNLFLAVDMEPLIGITFADIGGSFFVDEEKKVVVVLDKDTDKSWPPTRNIAYIIGNNGYFKQVDLGESRDIWCYPLVCSYVPSSVQLPVTSLGELRWTCKKWKTLTKGGSFLKRRIANKKQRKGIEVVMMLEYRVSLMSVDLLYPSIERIGNLDADEVEISKIFHCDGLFLCCITKDKDSSRLLVCNPYLAQTRWIEPRNSYHRWDRYALGYDNEKKNHKVLRFVDDYDSVKHRNCEFEMYSLNSNSWKVMDDFTLDWGISFTHRGLSLKGNTYWYAEGKIPLDSPRWISDLPDCLLSFDFTTERFGPPLPLPFHAFRNTVTLSSVREEQLAVLLQNMSAPYTVKIWITTKIEPNSVSWSNLFLAVDMEPLIGITFADIGGSFFVDEEKKVAVVLDKDTDKSWPPTRNIAYIIGNNGYFKQVDLGESRDIWCYPLVCSYVPSSVQLHH